MRTDVDRFTKPLLLTRDEACRVLGVKLSHYKDLVGRGEIREIAIGLRGKRLPFSEAERFVKERLSEPEPQA
jgi:excisionase family DNA binding protein